MALALHLAPSPAGERSVKPSADAESVSERWQALLICFLVALFASHTDTRPKVQRKQHNATISGATFTVQPYLWGRTGEALGE